MEISESISFNVHVWTTLPHTDKKITTHVQKDFEAFVKAQTLCIQDSIDVQDNPFRLEVRVEDILSELWDFNVLVYDDPEDKSYVLKVRWLVNVEDIEEGLTMKEVHQIHTNAHILLRLITAFIQSKQ
jgi:hypothetical protein